MHLSLKGIKEFIIVAWPFCLLIAGLPAVLWYASYFSNSAAIEVPEPPSWIYSKTVLEQETKVSAPAKLALLKDPFRFQIQKKEKVVVEERPISIKLSMVIINQRHKICRINGKFYHEGEQGPEFQVERIEEDRVLVKVKGKKRWVNISGTT